MFRSVLLLFSLAFSTQVSAVEWLDNRASWNAAPEIGRYYFIQGAYTEMTQFVTGSVERNKHAKKIKECVAEAEVTDGQLVEIVNAYYEDLGNWKNPPHIALRAGLFRFCNF